MAVPKLPALASSMAYALVSASCASPPITPAPSIHPSAAADGAPRCSSASAERTAAANSEKCSATASGLSFPMRRSSA
ncbi:MAG TPA: hypothetical protein VF765_18185 [Polyangiaceae bacterium]